jgi:hypothetical protein
MRAEELRGILASSWVVQGLVQKGWVALEACSRFAGEVQQEAPDAEPGWPVGSAVARAEAGGIAASGMTAAPTSARSVSYYDARGAGVSHELR